MLSANSRSIGSCNKLCSGRFNVTRATLPSIFRIVSSYAGVRSCWRRRVEMVVEKIPVLLAVVPFAAFAVIHLFFHQSHQLSLAVAPFFLFSVLGPWAVSDTANVAPLSQA